MYTVYFIVPKGRVGIPLIGVGFLQLSSQHNMATVVLLVWLFTASLALDQDGTAAELITTLLSTGGVLSIGYQGWYVGGSPLALVGVILFVGGGIGVGADRERTLLGVRRENLFHYILGGGMLCFAAALPTTPVFA